MNNHNKKIISKKANNDIKKTKGFIFFLEKFPFIRYSLIFFIATLVYSQTITFGFTQFEDDYLISKNYDNLSNLENVDDIFFSNSFLSEYNLGFYRPLQTLSYMFDALIGGKDASIYHLTNVILHCLTCFFIFLLFKKLKFNNNISLFVAILYSVHPLFVHTVAWLPARGDLLLCLFCVISFIFIIKFNENPKWRFLLLHIIFFLLAGLSKETALLFPIIIFYWFFIFNKNKIISKHGIALLTSWILIIGYCLIMRFTTIDNVLGKEDFGIIPFLNNLATIPEIIGKFILPIKIQVIPNFNTLNTSVGLIIMSILIFLFIFNKTANKKILLFGLLWFLILTLPGLFYGRKFTDSDHLFDYQDHRNYLPMIGLVILLIELLPYYLSKIKSKNLVGIGVIILLIFSTKTFINSLQYKDPISFFSAAINDNPKISGLYFLRAGIYNESENYDKALLDFNQTIRFNPEHADAYNNRASIKAMTGNFSSALNDLNIAIRLNPKINEGYFNRAVVKDKLGDMKGAIKDYSVVINQNPNDYLTLNERGLLKMSLNDINSAIEEFSMAIKINNKHFKSYFNRGTAYLKNRDYANAIKDFEASVKINPSFSDAYLNCGIAKYQIQQIDEACQFWIKAKELGNKTANQMLDLYCK